MSLFKTPSERLITNEKIRLTRLKKAYQLELGKLPSGTIQTLTVAGKGLLYLVEDGFGKRDGKCINHLSRHQIEELRDQLDRRNTLEYELRDIIKELGKIERAFNTDTIEEYVTEFKAKNPMI